MFKKLATPLFTKIGFFAIAGLLLAVAIQSGRLSIRTGERDVAIAYGDQVAEATRGASGNTRLARQHVPAQILAMGRGLDTLRTGLERCNASARAAAENDARRQREAAQRENEARERAANAEATSARLRLSATRGAAAGANCEASEAVREIWR